MNVSADRLPTRRSALAALAAVAALGAQPAAAQGAPIRLGTSVDDAAMQPFFAQDLGLFKKAGLDVDITTFVNSASVAEAMAGGAIDVGLMDPTQTALASLHGLPFAYFAGGPVFTTSNPTLLLCASSTGPVRTAKDLEGKTIAVVTVHSFLGVSIQEWLKVNGADPARVKYYEMRYPLMYAALTRGTVDAALLGEPYLSSNAGEIRRLGSPFESVAKAFYIYAWAARRDWIAANADRVRKLTDILYQTARWANSHRAESAPIEAKYTKMDVAIIRAMERNSFATNYDSKLVQPVLDLAARYNLLPRQVAAAEISA